MNISDKILRSLNEPRLRYKGMTVNMFGIPIFESYKKQTLKNSIYALKQEGYIELRNGTAAISAKGRKYIEKKLDSLTDFVSPFQKDSPKNLIVMYDVPEEKKAEREWLRFHLKKFGYEMIQRSVWVGPSPLPADFVEYVKKIDLRDKVKTFKLEGNYKPERNFL